MVLSRCMILLACFRWKYLTEGSSQSQVTKNETIPTANSHSNFAGSSPAQHKDLH